MVNKNKIGIKVICNHCKYEWLTNSEQYITSCPRCEYRVRLKERKTFFKGARPANNSILRFKILLRDSFTCQYCGRTIKDNIILNVDHIVPVYNGGKFIEDNLITCCNLCNSSKGNMILNDEDIKKIKNIEKPVKSVKEILELF